MGVGNKKQQRQRLMEQLERVAEKMKPSFVIVFEDSKGEKIFRKNGNEDISEKEFQMLEEDIESGLIDCVHIIDDITC